MINMIIIYISPRIFFLITIILILLGVHLLYGCCAISINKKTENEINNSINNDKPFNTQDELTDLYNKYTTENHFYIPNKSLSAEEIKNIAHRGGNNNI